MYLFSQRPVDEGCGVDEVVPVAFVAQCLLTGCAAVKDAPVGGWVGAWVRERRGDDR